MKNAIKSQDQTGLQNILSAVSSSLGRLAHDDPFFDRLWNYIPFPVMLPYHASSAKTNALLGGNRSGKTRAAIQVDVVAFTGIMPPALQWRFPVEEITPEYWLKIKQDVKYAKRFINRYIDTELPPLFPLDTYNWTQPRHVSIVVVDYEHHWPEVLRRYLCEKDFGIMPEAYQDSWSASSHAYTANDESTLIIQSPGPSEQSRRMRGTQKHRTHIDEPSSYYAYSESVARSTDVDGVIDITACPQDGYNWLYTEIWRKVYDENNEPMELPDPDVFCQRVEIHDNPTLTEEQKQRVISKWKPHERASRELGYFAEASGNPAFQMDILDAWKDHEKWKDGQACLVLLEGADEYHWPAELRKLSAVSLATGAIWRVWHWPEKDRKYVCWLDPSMGYESSDWQACDVWDVTDTPKMFQCAQLRVKMPPQEFSDQCMGMCTIFGQPLCVLETNETSSGVILERIRYYPNLYVRKTEGTVTEKQTKKLGWFTDRWNKPKIVNKMNELMFVWSEIGWCPLRSPRTLLEMRVYEETTEKGKDGQSHTVYKAMGTYNDDTVMTAMGCCYIGVSERLSLTTYQEPKEDAAAEPGGFLDHEDKTKRFGKWHRNTKNLRQLGAASTRGVSRGTSSGRFGIKR